MPARTLFSQHHLDTRLPALPEWAEYPYPAFDALRSLWESARAQRDLWSEAQA